MAPSSPSGSSIPQKGFSLLQVAQGTSATVLAAAIVGTATGVGWLAVNVPSRLQQLENNITQILKNQDLFGQQFQELKKEVQDLDRRTIKLELNR